jgi:hypothetical protein
MSCYLLNAEVLNSSLYKKDYFNKQKISFLPKFINVLKNRKNTGDYDEMHIVGSSSPTSVVSVPELESEVFQ